MSKIQSDNSLSASGGDIHKLKRNSSIELFRILVTFFVIFVHMNGYFIGLDSRTFNFHSIPQILVHSFTCVAVNGFIIITGFFGTKLTFHTLWKLWQSLICIYIPLFILKCIFDFNDLTFNEIIKALMPFSSRDGFFINGYLFLIIVSPFINAYINSKPRRQVLIMTFGLLFFEFWVDCLCNLKTFFFNEGYSGLHFCVLYMVGQSIKLYIEDLKSYKPLFYIGLYFILSSVIFLLTLSKIPWTYYYSNIFMVLSAASLFIAFALRKPFYNNIINRFAQCSLFVYILQIVSPFQGWLMKIDTYLLQEFSLGYYYILLILICIFFYLFCFIWDSVRLKFTKTIFDSVELYLNKHINYLYNRVIS